MSPEDLMDNIKDFGMKEVGAGSEYVVKKIRDLVQVDRQPLDDTTLIISHLKRE